MWDNSQKQTLIQLLKKAGSTEIGKKYGFDSIQNYEEFVNRIPLLWYDDIRPDIEKMKKGRADVLWPGKIQNYAVSSGTTGKGKHLPLSKSRITSDKKFMTKLAINYIGQRPNVLKISGTHLSLPGSVEQQQGIRIGEVSAFSALHSSVLLRLFQLIDLEKMAGLNFKDKFALVLEKAADANVKVIIGVPGWILTLFQQLLERTGKTSIAEIWPNLNLLICGGVKLDNFMPHLQELLGPIKPDFIETYGASEGYFAFRDDLTRQDLGLVTGNGIFYEFIPRSTFDIEEEITGQHAVPLWEVEKSVPYAMVVTTNAGLWRYPLRDVVEFTSVSPHRLLVRGRTSEMLDDFGEALYIYEAEQVLEEALHKKGLKKSTFAIMPVLPSSSNLPLHRWVIQFVNPADDDILNELAENIDERLREINRHYATRRDSDSLAAPRLRNITQKQINHWLSANNKAGAQGKFPKIIHSNTEILWPVDREP